MTDRVVLRRYKTFPHEVLAFLPDVPANPGRIMSYQHVGQHGEADREFYLTGTVPIKGLPYDAAALLAELRCRGYNLRRVERIAQ